MPHFTYPDASDVADKLKSSKLWPFNANDQARALDQASIGAASVASEWEKRTAWEPFLVGYDASVAVPGAYPRPFAHIDRDGTLQFKAACVSIESVVIGSRVVHLGEYELLRGEELAYRPPYTGIRFFHGCGLGNHYSSGHSPVRTMVTAKWGYCDILPDFVWQQCQQAGALIALTSVENLQNVASISQDGFNKAFDVVGVLTQTELVQEWGKNFLLTVQQYKREVVF